MNKNILQKFATEARQELKKKVISKAFEYGIDKDGIKKGQVESSDSIVVDGRILDKIQKKQRRKLIDKIEMLNEQGSDGFDVVVEEVAYTWFNRLIALRFLEVNRYIKTRALSSEEGNNIPDIVTEALDVNFIKVRLDEDYIRKLKLSGDSDATKKLFKYMIISQCNELHDSLPFMFEKISDYTELLFPDVLLDENSFAKKMTDTEYIPEKDWKEVEIIGWLYQYYIAEEKDRVIKAKKKYKKEEIPYATQLFTPKWIVKYMVQNSLGRYWLESNPEDDELKKEWEFYLENPEKEDDFEEKIAPYINKEMKVEDIKCFDPACGSGHILVYMFEVLYEIYSRVGYEAREIPKLIIENNLYGLDIDDRAYQLACFAVVMKGASYDKMLLRRIEKEKQETGRYIKFNIASIQETNNLNDIDIAYIAGERSGKNFDKTKKFIETFYNGKTYGSLIKIDEFDKEFFEERLDYIKSNIVEDIEMQSSKGKGVEELLERLISQADIMINTFDILVTNPPYMGGKYMNPILTSFIKDNYKETKYDLFSAFIEYSTKRVIKNGQLGFITPYVWMFISSYQDLRKYIIDRKSISSLIQLEYNAFPEACVPVCTYTLRNYNSNISGEYIKLSDFRGSETQEIKVKESINNNVSYRYTVNNEKFKIIEGNPIAYWMSNKVLDIFEQNKKLGDIAAPRKGNSTSDNKRFLRLWHEVLNRTINFNKTKIIKEETIENRWFPYNKGGGYRKWYGNNEYLIDWKNDAEEIRNIPTAVIANYGYFMKPGLTWSTITSTKFSIRAFDEGFIFDNGGCCLFTDDTNRLFYLSLLNSKVFSYLLGEINPTLNFQSGEVAKFPVIIPENDTLNKIKSLAEDNYRISKDDWDSMEISWDFKKSPLLANIKINSHLENIFNDYVELCNDKINKMKRNEESINEILINTYDINNELGYEVENKDITLLCNGYYRYKKKNNKKNDDEYNNLDSENEENTYTSKEMSKFFKRDSIKEVISYAVGCMLGRYSLDVEGLIYAGGEFDSSKYTTFKADEDNIIPILDENYFEDDIANRFIEFVQVTFGKETLNENLDYIAETLGKKSGESSKDTMRRYFLNDFYKDHVQTYKKRPIYWLVTSGKQKSFNALIYMHRYDKNTLSRIRTDYVHPLQNKLEVEKSRAEEDLSFATKASERNLINRKITNIEKQIDELKKFEELLHDYADKQIEIDLDNGVVHNYGLFKGLLGKI